MSRSPFSLWVSVHLHVVVCVCVCVCGNMLCVCCMYDRIGGLRPCCKSVSTKFVVSHSLLFLIKACIFSSLHYHNSFLQTITRHLSHMYVGEMCEQLAYLLLLSSDQICKRQRDNFVQMAVVKSAHTLRPLS